MNECNIALIAAQSFADHIMTDEPSRSWRLGKQGTGYHAFRVTWSPGVLTISGDIGSAVYEVWPGLNTVTGSVEFVSRANFDYLSEKGSIKKEFDREATAEHILETAYEYLRTWKDARYIKQVCDEYGGDPADAFDRKEAARALRDDPDLTADRAYDITNDAEVPVYAYPAAARWAFEALKLWAAKMQAASLEAGEAA